MAIQWHPFLAQFLRREYGDRLIIEEEVMGELPLRVDLVLIRRDPAVALPYPLNHLGATTLVSFKGPQDVAGQADLRQLEIYNLLYQEKARLPRRSEVSLWLLASRYQRRVSWRDGAYLARAKAMGPGVRAGSLDRFPTCLINLNELPVEQATWPLVMVSRGPAERPLVEYFLDHWSVLRPYWLPLLELHGQTFLEVTAMKEQMFEEMSPEDEKKYAELLVRFFGGQKRLLHILGEEQVVQALGEEHLVQALGEERLMRVLIRELGAERVQEMVQQLAQESSTPTDQN